MAGHVMVLMTMLMTVHCAGFNGKDSFAKKRHFLMRLLKSSNIRQVGALPFDDDNLRQLLEKVNYLTYGSFLCQTSI